jgi:phage repressor protein C with HTH and peptisase S24 domain
METSLNKNQTFFDRILQIIEFKGINSVNEFAINYLKYDAPQKINRLKKEGANPSYEIILDIVNKFEDINPQWLLTGEGEMTKNSQLELLNDPEPAYGKKVPYYDIDFTASFLEIHNDQKSIPDHYVSHPFFQGCDYIVRASGQSMAKVIKHGDAIGLVEIKNWQEFIPLGEIYAIVTKNQFRMIKIITKGEDKESFTLISKPMDGKKEEFPPQQIKKDQILSIFRVQASSHLF